MINGMRHRELYDPARYAGERVALIGVGTIGSHLALTLARMQIPFTMYDHDTIEEHNLATQAYTRRDLGRYKVDAIKRMCEEIGAEEDSVRAVARKYDGELADEYTMIVSCVDSIDARREIAQSLIDINREEELGLNEHIAMTVIDGRVGAEQVEVYRYDEASEWLTDLPAHADTDPCGARFTAYTANVCAGLMANAIKRELLGQSVPKRILYDAFSSTFIKQI